MFYGEYEHTLDEKNRLTLPARFRHSLASGVVLARGIERNVDVYPSDTWHENMARIAELDSLSREAREMKRYVFAGAAVAELDRQGRVLCRRTSLSTQGSAKTSSWRASTTTSRSGTGPHGRPT